MIANSIILSPDLITGLFQKRSKIENKKFRLIRYNIPLSRFPYYSTMIVIIVIITEMKLCLYISANRGLYFI